MITKSHRPQVHFGLPSRVAAAVLALSAAALPTTTLAGPALSFYSSAGVYGYLNTQYSSPLLGDTSFTLNGSQDWRYNSTGSGVPTTGIASTAYSVSAGAGGTDPLYDIVTSNGQYGFHYDGQAEAAGMNLRTQINTSTVDTTGQRVDSTPNTSLSAYSQAQWNQQFYVGATLARPTGAYGAVLVGITLDGAFPALTGSAAYNNGYASLQASSSFTDASGVSYSSNFSTGASSGDSNWAGSVTIYKKLLIQFGTPFSIGLYQYAGAGNNGSADFFNTGRVSSIEIPYGATLDSGASQAGLGSLSQLYGSVYNSPTVEDENTNWDFGNGGGGFTPPVPEPQPWALLLAGLGVIGHIARRRNR